MFNKKEFEDIYKLIINNNKIEAQKNLKLLRTKYDLHPDYLFLMSLFLTKEHRYYQAIDTLHSSLLVDNDEIFLLKKNYEKSSQNLIDAKFKLLSEIFKIINNPELSNEAEKLKNAKEQFEFFKKLQILMPGIGFKKK